MKTPFDEIKNWYVVEYDLETKTIHIHTIEEMIETNLRTINKGIKKSYLPVGIAKTSEEAYEISHIIADKFGEGFNQQSR